MEAGESKNYPLNFRIADFLDRGLAYACVSAEPSFPGYSDLAMENNKICVSLNELFTILEPFPNPADDELIISYIASNAGEPVRLRLSDLYGHLLMDVEVYPDRAGVNVHKLDVSRLAPGVYALRAAVNNQVLSRKIEIR